MSNSTIIKKLFFIGLKFKKWFIITLLISLAVAFISTYRPILTKEIVDLVIIKEKSRTELMNGIYLLLGMVLLETFLQVMLYYLSNFIAQSVIRDIRERLYTKLIHFKTSFFDKTPIGNLVTRARCRNRGSGLYGWFSDGFWRCSSCGDGHRDYVYGE